MIAVIIWKRCMNCRIGYFIKGLESLEKLQKGFDIKNHILMFCNDFLEAQTSKNGAKKRLFYTSAGTMTYHIHNENFTRYSSMCTVAF